MTEQFFTENFDRVNFKAQLQGLPSNPSDTQVANFSELFDQIDGNGDFANFEAFLQAVGQDNPIPEEIIPVPGSFLSFVESFETYLANNSLPVPAGLTEFMLEFLATDVSRFLAVDEHVPQVPAVDLDDFEDPTSVRTELSIAFGTNVVQGDDLVTFVGGDTESAILAQTIFAKFIRTRANRIFGPGATVENFFAEFVNFLRPTALIRRTGTNFEVTAANSNIIEFNNLLTYQAIWEEMTPELAGGETTAERVTRFWEDMNNFVNQLENDNGYFAPAQFIDDWVLKVKGDNFPDRNLIVFILFDLLLEILATLELTTVQQSRRIQFLADLQASYTDLLDDVQFMTSLNTGLAPAQTEVNSDPPEDGDFANLADFRFPDYDAVNGDLFLPQFRFSARGSEDTTARNDFNTRMESYAETLRTKRSNAKDDSRAAEAQINSLNDAISQQSNLGTSLLQILGGLLTSIFR